MKPMPPQPMARSIRSAKYVADMARDADLADLEGFVFGTLASLGYTKRKLTCELELDALTWLVSVDRIPRVGRRLAVVVGAWWPAMDRVSSAMDCDVSMNLAGFPVPRAAEAQALLALHVEIPCEERYAVLGEILTDTDAYLRGITTREALRSAIMRGEWNHAFISKVAKDELGISRLDSGAWVTTSTGS